MLQQLKLRSKRGWSIFSVGPNEARILFDVSVTTASALVAWLFCRLFIAPSAETAAARLLALMHAGLLPIFFAIGAYLAGVYSRLRTASGRIKAAALLFACFISAASSAVISGDGALVVLWILLTAPPLVIVRLLLNMPYSKHKNLVVEAVRQRGPVTVIGGAGYIGSHVVDVLLKEGQSVRVLDRLMYGKDSLREFNSNPNFQLIEGDATDITRLTIAMKGASAVVHLAGLVGDPACGVDQAFTRHTNIIATRMAKEIAKSLGVFRFVFASSCSVYGSSDREVNEKDGLNPVSLYAQTKIDSEKELLYTVPDDFFVTVLRFATVFGHSRRPRFDLVANLFTAQALTNGVITVSGPQQWRPFIHVRDLARAVALVLKTDPCLIQSQIFNVGDKRLNMTILQLAQTVQEIVRPVRPAEICVKEDIADRRNYAVSFDKIRNLLGFEAETSMSTGISEMVQNFQAGLYDDYKKDIYSNVAMTRRALEEYFKNPARAQQLYAPLVANSQ